MSDIFDVLISEHHLTDSLLTDCLAALARGDLAEASESLDRFTRVFTAHAKVEDEALFPAMTRRRLVRRDDVNDMAGEHTKMLKLVDEIDARIRQGDCAQAAAVVETLQRVARGHAQKEELLLLVHHDPEVASECPPYPEPAAAPSAGGR
ncbi:MAG: hypothetical protein HONDAALG_03968 [Gammaproteobacteria bacterium]|nr:hypothetical protein [Gammaproteobacteria bacterium]